MTTPILSGIFSTLAFTRFSNASPSAFLTSWLSEIKKPAYITATVTPMLASLPLEQLRSIVPAAPLLPTSSPVP